MKHLALFICFALLTTLTFSQDWTTAFNDKLTAEEKAKLNNGEALIRNIGKASRMCLTSVTPQAGEVLSIIQDLNPAYLAEIIQIRPYEGNEELVSNLKPLLLDFQSYVGIPYWSERNQQFYDLYSEAEIYSLDQTETTAKAKIRLFMNPFGNINMDVNVSNTNTEIIYLMNNTSNVKYSNITILKPNRMKSLVYAFKYGDNIILYGVGGVNAPSIWFLQDRIETSFINRIKTFCQFMFEKI
jgi:hypothetical protein